MLSPRGKKELKINQRRILINSIEIGIPAPEQVFILGERHTSNGKVVGRVRNSKTLNYKSFTPHRDGLFCERIFGPVQSYICACGKQGPLTTSKGTLRFCPRCEVEYTDQRARRYRVGYIGLVSPVTHIWHLKGRPSYLSLFLGKRKKTLATLAYCNDYLVEQGFTKVDVNGMFTQPSARNVKQHPEIGADFFKNRVLKGLQESKVIKGLTLSREQEKSKVWSLSADFIDGPFSNTVGEKPPAGGADLTCPTDDRRASRECSPSEQRLPNRRFGTGRYGPTDFRSTWIHRKKTSINWPEPTDGPCSSKVTAPLAGAFGKLTARSTIEFTKAADRVASLYDLKKNSNQEQMKLELTRFARPSLRPSAKDKQNPKRATFLKYLLSPEESNILPPLGQTDLHSARSPKVAVLAAGEPPFLAQVKREASQKKATLSYTRSQALPFLPTFICEFHLRDGLLSFFDTFPPVEDIPIPVYCKIPRRYPLRDVHKFMADQAFSKVQVQQSSKKGRARRASAGYRRGPFELNFDGGRRSSQPITALPKRRLVTNRTDTGTAYAKPFGFVRAGGEHEGKVEDLPSQVSKYSKIFCRIGRRSGSFNKSVSDQDGPAVQLVAMNQIGTPARTRAKRELALDRRPLLTEGKHGSVGPVRPPTRLSPFSPATSVDKTTPAASLINVNVFSHNSIRTVKNKTLPLREVLLSILLDRIVTTLIGLTPTLATERNRTEPLLTRSKPRQRPVLLGGRQLLTFSDRSGGQHAKPSVWHAYSPSVRKAVQAQWRKARTRAKRELALVRRTIGCEPAESTMIMARQVGTAPIAHLRWAQPGQAAAPVPATNSGKVRTRAKRELTLVPLVQLAKKALLSKAEHDRADGRQDDTSYLRRKLVLEGLRFKGPKQFWLPVIGESPTRLTIQLLFDKGLSELPSTNKAWIANFNRPKPNNRPSRRSARALALRAIGPLGPVSQTFGLAQSSSYKIEDFVRILSEQLHRRPFEIPAHLERQHGLLCFGESVEDWLEAWFDRWLQNYYGANPVCTKLSVWHRTVGQQKQKSDRARARPAGEQGLALRVLLTESDRAGRRHGPYGPCSPKVSTRRDSAGDRQKVAEATQWVALAPRAGGRLKGQQPIGPYVTQWPEKPIEQSNDKQDSSSKDLIFSDTRNAKNYITNTVIFEDSDAPTCKSIEDDISVEGMVKDKVESLTSSRVHKALNRYRAALTPVSGLQGSRAQPAALLTEGDRARRASPRSEQKQNALLGEAEHGPLVNKDGSDSYIKSQLDLQAIQEILSYTGGGALREVLRCFDTHAFSAILLNEIKLLREYHKGYFLYEYDQLSRKAMIGDVGPACYLTEVAGAVAQSASEEGPKHALAPTADVATKVIKGEQADGQSVENTIDYPLLAKRSLVRRTSAHSRFARVREQKQTVLHRQVGSTLIGDSACLPKLPEQTAPAARLWRARQTEGLAQAGSGWPHSSYGRVRSGLSKHTDYEELPEEINRFSRAIHRNARRLKIVQLLLRNRRRPEWMLISALPVLPPDLRPILQMSENLIVASDLNTLYQRVIYRNNRQYKLRIVEWSYATSLQRLVQDAVDRLIENGKGGSKPFLTPSGRPLKSLSDTLKGKKGRFRLNLLGKRVDFSGRSVIVVSPHLKIHECGLPRDMALELYQYLLIRQMLLKRQVSSVILAKRVIRQQKAFVWDTLRELIYHHPLLLNRAPTLHRLGIQAFQPKLVLGSTILLHPLVCAGFNADFDGDQMGVHLPLCDEARAEAWDLLWSRNNLLSPATGEPILLPSQDMVLGFYHMSALLPSRHANSTAFEGGRPMQNRTILQSARSARAIARTSAEANAEKNLRTSSLTLASLELERGFLRLLRKLPTDSRLARKAQLPDGRSDQRSLLAQELNADRHNSLGPYGSNRDWPPARNVPATSVGAPAAVARSAAVLLSEAEQHTNSNKIALRQGFGFVQIDAALSQVGTPVLFKKGLRESHFFSPLDVVRAYQNGDLDIHHPIWLQWNGRIENNDSDQTPLEIRINTFGVSTQLYPSYKYRKDSNASALGSKLSATFNLFIRTTPGRVIVNNIFPLV